MSKATIVVDLGFGDSGKGAHVDFLCENYGAKTVVRFNGGGQAGHNVVRPNFVHHEFHHFGAGTFSGAKTFLSEYMMISPLPLWQEAIDLQIKGIVDPFSMLWVDPRCKIVTPFHAAANQLRELARGESRHGSCGMGIGETVMLDRRYPEITICANDIVYGTYGDLWAKLRSIQKHLELAVSDEIDQLKSDPAAVTQIIDLTAIDTCDSVADFCKNSLAKYLQIAGPNFLTNIMRNESHVVFEAAQGVLLDEAWGFFPHTTWSKTTRENADALITEAQFEGNIECHGLIRAYQSRHGAGPMPTQDDLLSQDVRDKHNGYNPWQRHFRNGWLDLNLVNYAIEVNGPVDGLVVSCIDQLHGRKDVKVCTSYQDSGPIPKPVEKRGDKPCVVSTAYLNTAKPVYETLLAEGERFWESEEKRLLDLIADGTGHEIIAQAHGPMHTDRMMR